MVVRDATVGTVQLYSDYLWKPLLTTLHNAVLQPALEAIRHVAVGVRAALQPLALVLLDLMEPVAFVLGSLRPFYVERKCDDRAVV